MFFTYETDKLNLFKRLTKIQLSRVVFLLLVLVLLLLSLLLLNYVQLLIHTLLIIIAYCTFFKKNGLKKVINIILQFKFFLIIVFLFSFIRQYNIVDSLVAVLKMGDMFLCSYLFNLALDYHDLLYYYAKIKKSIKSTFLRDIISKILAVFIFSLKVLPDIYKKGVFLKDQLDLRCSLENRKKSIQKYLVLINSLFIHSLLEAKQLEKLDQIYVLQREVKFKKNKSGKNSLMNILIVLGTVLYIIGITKIVYEKY